MSTSRFYVTTPIYYVNALPHLGTFYSTVVADAFARYHRARGHETFFLTGLDEHGQKIERIARERGQEPQAYCDGVAAEFQAAWKRFGVTNDDFIRTTQPRHEAAVAEMWQRLVAAGDIYPHEYDGMYCVGCEEAKTEDDVLAVNGEKICKIHLRPVELVKEKNYFFRLSKYADRLVEWYGRTPSPIQPESRRNEVLSFVKGGLRDISVSRKIESVRWGIPVPGDATQTVYVWIDALTNYLTVLGGPNAVAAGQGRGAFWAASHHLIAKDILRFHAVYWPAMLWSAGLEPPTEIFCHGYLTVKGQKISKSMPATRVDPNAIAAELGVDTLRYFVLREYTFGGDGDFTYEALFQRYESDLGNDLGNLLNRTIAMAHKFVGAELPARDRAASPASGAFAEQASSALQTCQLAWDEFNPSGALQATWGIVREANAHIERTKPWALAKDPGKREELLDMLAVCCETLRWAALTIAPAMPTAAAEILRQLGREADAGAWPSRWAWPGGTLSEPKPIFPRVEPERQQALIAKWVPAEAPAAAPAAPPKAAHATPVAPGEITIDDFAKIELRAAKVLTAERVPKADKLLKLTLDVGTGEPRTVVSGIAAAYAPEQLVGRTVIYLANLKPAKLRGVVSQGMILAAGDADVLALSALDRDVPPGTIIR
ncbi:MAG TPA: methionine--tRNA ligase [Polyangia bacterium]|jgi:methionyl-tRNA synthetase|nr:methionine--tRNA ligase [Polyangia bacterium]